MLCKDLKEELDCTSHNLYCFFVKYVHKANKIQQEHFLHILTIITLDRSSFKVAILFVISVN